MKAALFVIAVGFFALSAQANDTSNTAPAAHTSAAPVADPQHKDHKHKHGAKCGHKSKKHGDHTDYAHDGHQHKAHGDHFDECQEEAAAAAPAEVK